MKNSKQIEWEFTYSTDGGETWSTNYFESLDDARAFANKVADANESPRGFQCFARKMVVVATSDFFDSTKQGGAIRMAW